MECRDCGRALDADAHFCPGCGIALEATCIGCGAALDADARSCQTCGQPVATGTSADTAAGEGSSTASDEPTR